MIQQLQSHSESVDALKAAHQERETSLNAMVVALQEENGKVSELETELDRRDDLIRKLEKQGVQVAHEHALVLKDCEANAALKLNKQVAEVARLQAVNESISQHMAEIREGGRTANETCADLRSDKEILKHENAELIKKINEYQSENLSLRTGYEQLEDEMRQFREAVGSHIELKNF